MKQAILLISFLVSSISFVNGQTYSDIQTIVPADLESDLRVKYSTRDNFGNTIVTGQFAGTLLFSGSSITLSNLNWQLPYGDNYVSFIAKLNNDGTWAWAKKLISVRSIGFPQWMEVRGITTDAAGNILVVGDFAGTANLDNIIITSNYQTNGGYGATDIYVAKMNSAGVFLWAKSEGGSLGPELGRDLAVDASGNVIIVGSYTNKVATCGNCYPRLFLSDVFIAKFNSAGIQQWSKKIGSTTVPTAIGNSTNTGFAIETDAVGNFYIGGKFIGTVKFDNITVKSRTAKIMDAFAVKYNSSGMAQWVKTGSTTANTTFQRSSIDNSGNIYFSGRGNAGNMVLNGITYNNVSNSFLLKLNNNGITQWIKNAGTANWSPDDYAPRSILVNSSGNIDVLPDANPNTSNNYLAEYNSNGNILFTESLANVYVGDLCKNAGGVTVTMNFENTVTLPTLSGHVTITIPYMSQYRNMGMFIANYTPASPSPITRKEGPQEEKYMPLLTLYPNPVFDQVTIRNSNNQVLGNLAIYDNTGKIVYHGFAGATQATIDVHKLIPGIYYLGSGQFGKAIKFVIQ